MRSFVSVCSMDAPEKIHGELLDLVLKTAQQVLTESASHFEKAIASKILGRKYDNFRVLTIEDFLADIVCGGEKWREYRKKLHHLGYMVELAPLVLYILIDDQCLEDAKELFDLVNKTEVTLQKQGKEFTDVYVEIMKWVAKKMGLNYSPPKSCIKFPEDYSAIIQTVLNYDAISSPPEIGRVKHSAQQRISNMLSEGIWDVIILYFAWKLSRLFSLPQLTLKDQATFIRWRYRKNWLIYHIIRWLPEILIAIVSSILTVLTQYNLTIAVGGIVVITSIITKIMGLLPQQVQKLVNRCSYYIKIKSELEKDKQLLKEFKKFVNF
ncbi:MAG: hypothetical protein QXV01_11065 [Candidatus Bathyarchaeia archaeon]